MSIQEMCGGGYNRAVMVGGASTGDRHGHFPTTHWSVVLAAGDCAHPGSRDALSELCTLYWAPVRAFVRRRAGDAAADDLTQGFFAALLERGALSAADQDRGRFRGFLLTSVKYYLADQWDRAHAQKRGGGDQPLSLDHRTDDVPPIDPPDPSSTPDREYDRQWALTLLELVRARLDAELATHKDPTRMRRLASALTDSAEARYRDIARDLQMNESAVKVSVHRLRKRYAAILREEVLRTVSTPKAVDEELRFLLTAVSG
jgi:DNA-directed RNA polymerase specialized sigma24 family protein